MKVFLSVDIEGVCGASRWEDTKPGHKEFAFFQEQMTKEAAAACEGALEAGADEVVVRDAHEHAANIDMNKLPRSTKLIRGWMNTPLAMMEGLDSGFAAAICIGYHSGGSMGGSNLAHTITSARLFRMTINGETASEYTINALTSNYLGVPVVFVSGDKALCEAVHLDNPNIEIVAVKEGFGKGMISIHPDEACDRIRAGVKKGLEKRDLNRADLPDVLEITWTFHSAALSERGSYYPGVKRLDPCTLTFSAENVLEMLRATMFVLSVV